MTSFLADLIKPEFFKYLYGLMPDILGNLGMVSYLKSCQDRVVLPGIRPNIVQWLLADFYSLFNALPLTGCTYLWSLGYIKVVFFKDNCGKYALMLSL